MSTKMRPGITIDKDVWDEFKDSAVDSASKVVEDFMRAYSKGDEVTVSSVEFNNLDQWSINYTTNNSMVASFSASVDGNSSTTSNLTNLTIRGFNKDVDG